MQNKISLEYKHNTLTAWFIWFIAALFYAFEFLQRVMPGVIATPLRETFHISSAMLGSVDSLYFYAYAISQIFAGLFLDRFGARLCLSLAAIAVALGTFLFAHSTLIATLALARIIVGIGSAFAFVGCLKLASTWFPQKRFALIVGLTNMLGTVGALFGEEPLSLMVKSLGWQQSLIVSSFFGIAIALLVIMAVRNSPKLKNPKLSDYQSIKQIKLWQGLWQIIKTKQTWLNAIFASIMVAPVIAFAELWAVPYLSTVRHIPAHIAAELNSLIFIGIAIGAPLNGVVAGWISNRKLIMFLGNLVSLFSLSALILMPTMPKMALIISLTLLGYSASSMLLCFSINTQQHKKDISGTVIAFTNMVIMIVGAIFQPLIGCILDKLSDTHHVMQYTGHNFKLALACLPIALAVNLLFLLLIKEPPTN